MALSDKGAAVLKKSVIYFHGDIYHFSTLAQCDITLAYHNTQVWSFIPILRSRTTYIPHHHHQKGDSLTGNTRRRVNGVQKLKRVHIAKNDADLEFQVQPSKIKGDLRAGDWLEVIAHWQTCNAAMHVQLEGGSS
ncbi:Uncharacterized protein HZ326_23720 [Fusarium oxysporum f. sp. albedinis]|nr:Uncharacterized protein HZ326_23720 [Fusarium oxysporum f. sp. albedinis]